MTVAPTPEDDKTVVDSDAAAPVDTGSTIFRLREAERAAGAEFAEGTKSWRRYEAAVAKAGTEEEKIAAAKLRPGSSEASLRGAWESLIQSLRLAEQTELHMAKERGDLVDRSQVAAALRDFHNTQVIAFRGFLRRIGPRLRALAPSEWEKTWEDESEKFLAAFRDELSVA